MPPAGNLNMGAKLNGGDVKARYRPAVSRSACAVFGMAGSEGGYMRCDNPLARQANFAISPRYAGALRQQEQPSDLSRL